MALGNTIVACTALGRQLVVSRVGKDRQSSLEQRSAEGEIMNALVDFMTGREHYDFILRGKRYRLSVVEV